MVEEEKINNKEYNNKIFTLKKLLISLKLLFTFSIAYYIYTIVNIEKLLETLKSSNKIFIIIAIILLIPNLYIQYKKWHYLVDKAKNGVQSKIETIGSVFIGITFGIVTPGKVGELGKLFFISNVDRVKLLGYSIFEKIYDLFPVAIFGVISLPFLPYTFFDDFLFNKIYAFVFFFLISLFLLFIALNPSIFRVLLNYINDKFLSNKISKLTYSINHLEKQDASKLLRYSVLLNLIFSTQFVMLVIGFSKNYLTKNLNFITFVNEFITLYPASWVAFLLKTMLPFSVGDIGIREGTSKIVFSLYNINKESAISAAFLLFVINILIPSLIGIFLIPYLKIMKERRIKKRIIEK